MWQLWIEVQPILKMAEYLDESLLTSCSIRESKQSANNCSMTILDLPKEVLDHIFSFLTIKERIRTEWVCRRWAEFGKNYKWSWPKKLWSDVGSVGYAANEADIWSSVLSRCGNSLRELELTVGGGLYFAKFKTCHLIGAKCPNLTHISLVIRFPIHRYSLTSMAKKCTKLKKISIQAHESLQMPFDVSVNVFTALKKCRSLEYLEINSKHEIIVSLCIDAIKVPLKGFKLWTNALYSYYMSKKLLHRNDPVEELAFHWLQDTSSDWLTKVCYHYEHTLKKLSLPYCNMSSSNWCKIVVPLKHLEILLLQSSHLIDDSFMRVLAHNCKKLRKLDISETAVTDVGVSFLTTLPNLQVLSLNESEVISGEGILSLAACSRLEELYFAMIEHHDSVIEQACMALATKCQNFKSLDVRQNVNITQRLVDKFRSFIQRGKLKGPFSLYLSYHQLDQDPEDGRNFKIVVDHLSTFDIQLNSELWE